MYRIVMNVTIDWLRKKQVKGAGAEFDDAIQLKEIDPASRTVPHADPLPHERMQRQGNPRPDRRRDRAALAGASGGHLDEGN